MLQVVESACRFQPDMSRGNVVVESSCDGRTGGFQEAFSELDSMDARSMATGFAARHGMGDPRINGNVSSPYPVNADGVSLEAVKDGEGNPLPQTHPKMQPARYRVDVPVTRRLV